MCFSWRQLKCLDGEKEQREKDVAELQNRLSLEEQREEERGKEMFTLKQKLSEAETVRDALKKEVRMAGHEQEYTGAVMYFSLSVHCLYFSF